jgi:hypothetical protein
MIIPPLLEIGNVVVADSGVPNQERIVFRPTEPINLAQFGIIIAFRAPIGVFPYNDLFFWFSDIEIAPPCWVVVYTRKGEYAVEKHRQTGHPVHFFFWGRDTVLFPYGNIVPIVFRVDQLLIGGHEKPRPPLVLPPAPPPPSPS